jgi:predicted phage terminase large subunit-like protein
MSDKYSEIRPYSIFQEKYLKADQNILLIGGAAGSSKSYMGLMRHLRHAEDPNYKGMCIRKNSTAIMKTGGLFDEAVDLYTRYNPDVKIKLKEQKIVFPSKAVVQFSHYENRNAKNLYQGLQLSGIMYDEASHSEEEDIWWLISRLRSKAKCPHSIWLTVNPDPDSWILKYAMPYLHQEGHELAGRPDPEKNGTEKWLLRVAGDIVWGESKQELLDRYGNKLLPGEHPVKPRSFLGLFGTVDDNKPLLHIQPDYKANLESLPKAECERLRWGNWFARPTGSTFFSRHDVIELDTPPPRSEFVRVVRSYDFAGVLPNDNNRSPDYTASVKMGKLKTGDYVILEVTRTRMKFGTWMEHIYENAQRDGSNVEILLPEDPNPMAKASTVRMCRELTESGYAATYKRSGQGKLDSFRPFAASVQIGVVSVVKNCATDLWNKIYSDNSFFYNELEAFDGERRGGENGHDDMVDCCSSAYSYLASRFHIPNFLPGLKSADLSFNNPFAQ